MNARFVNRYEEDDYNWNAQSSLSGEGEFIFSIGAIKAPSEASALALAKTVDRVVHHGQWCPVEVRVVAR